MTEKRYIPPSFDPPQPRPDDSPPPWRAGALLSPQAAREAEWEGGERAELGFVRIFTLAVLGGAFVGLAVALAITLGVGAGALPYGVGRLLGGAIVALGYAAVVVTGGELFAANYAARDHEEVDRTECSPLGRRGFCQTGILRPRSLRVRPEINPSFVSLNGHETSDPTTGRG